jgi:hypothetical protein
MKRMPTVAAESTGPIARAFESWNRFWFRPTDPTTLGLIRICCGLIVLYVHLAYTFDLQALLGEHAWLDLQTINKIRTQGPVLAPPAGWEEMPNLPPPPEEQRSYVENYVREFGVDPRLAAFQGHPIWSIWFHVTDPTWMALTHGVVLVIMLFFTLGFGTRVTSVLTWLATLSYIQRGQTTLFGMDTIMNFVLLYLMIGPSGAALSVDRLICRYWATRRALGRRQPPPEFSRPTPRISANFALRLLQIHICFVYLASGLSKLQGSTWWQGTAVWGTAANYEFSPLTLQVYSDLLRYLAEHRWLWESVMTGGSVFTLVFEISFTYLIWTRRWRGLVIIAAVLLHMGIALFMGLVTFSLIMLTAVLAFVPAEMVQQLVWKLERGITHFRRGQEAGSRDGSTQRGPVAQSA